MKKKKWAYISLEVVFLLTIVVISGMYGTIKLFKHGQEAADQQNTAFEKVRSTLATGEGGLGGGGIPILPDDTPSDTIYWGIDASNKLIISDEPVTTATGGRSGSFSKTKEFTHTHDEEGEGTDTPWFSYQEEITSIEIMKVTQKIAPVSTAYWFAGLWNVEYVDVTNIDTSNVKNMSCMFAATGNEVFGGSFQITGMEEWDTSKVTNMSWMFHSVGHTATTWNIGNINNWDTSQVTDMSHMFSYAGGDGEDTFTINIGDWDVSNVVNMEYMFYLAGGNSRGSVTFGDIGSWDTRNVENMNYMFYSTAQNADYNLDLSEWNIDKVVSHDYFNYGVTTGQITAPRFPDYD